MWEAVSQKTQLNLDKEVQHNIQKFLSNNELDLQNLSDEDEDKLGNFAEKVLLWLEPVESEEHKRIFLNLLGFFDYFDKRKIKSSYKNQFEKLMLKEILMTDTIFLTVGSYGGIFNGASEIMPLFRRVNQLPKKRIAQNIGDFSDKYDVENSIKNIVLVDDIIGSGTTTKGYIEHLLKFHSKVLKNKKFYIISLVVIEKGVNVIKSFMEEKNLFVEILYEKELVKAFSFDNNKIFSNEEQIRNAKKIIKSYDNQIVKREMDILGYKGSQGLVAFYHNTPNNTLPIFWESGNSIRWNPLFPREVSSDELPRLEKHSNSSLQTIQLMSKWRKVFSSFIKNRGKK